MAEKEGKYAKAVANRRLADAEKTAETHMREIKDREQREERAFAVRQREAVAKAEFAYEVLRAILPEIREGKRLGANTVAKVADIGRKLGFGVTDELRLDKPLDREERRELPKKP